MRSLISDRLTRTFAVAKAATIHRYRRLLAFRTAIEVEVLDGLRAFFLDRLLASYRGFRLLGYRQGRGMRHFLLLSSERDGVVEVATR